MADNYWISTGSTDIGAAGNWSLGAIAGTDSVYFTNDSSTVSPSTNMSAWSALDVDLIHVERDWPGSIGGVGAPWVVSCDRVEYKGLGQMYYQDSGGTTDYFIVDSKRATGTDAVQLSGDTYTNLEVLRGQVTMANLSSATNIYMGYINNPSSDARLILASSVDAVTLLVINGGYFEANMGTNAIATALMNSGLAVVNAATLTNWVQTGGVTHFKTTTAAPQVVLLGGLFDLTQNSSPKTVTILEQLGGEFKDQGVTVTVTTKKKYTGK